MWSVAPALRSDIRLLTVFQVHPVVPPTSSAASADSAALLSCALSIVLDVACEAMPFPLDTALSTPWAENITTFAEALNSSLSANYAGPVPKVIRAVDRCWCDLSFGGLFASFNISGWERVSVLRLKNELEDQQRARDLLEQSLATEVLDTLNGTLSPTASTSTPVTPTAQPLLFRLPKLNLSSIRSLLNPRLYEAEETPSPVAASDASSKMEADPSRGYVPSPRELDLRRYGIDIIINYDWTGL